MPGSNASIDQILEEVQGNISEAYDPYDGVSLDLPENVAAHAGLLKLESGIVFAEVHSEDHDLFPYEGIIGEVNGFRLAVYPANIEVATPAGPLVRRGYIAEGTRTVNQEGVGAEFHYRMMKPEGLQAQLSVLQLDAKTTHPFPTEFRLTARQEVSADNFLSYIITLSGSLGFFTFDSGGNLSAAKRFMGGEESQNVPEDARPALFDLEFNCGRQIPVIDINATIPHIIRPFTGHAMKYSGRPAQQNLNSLIGWLVTKQP